MCGLGDRRLYPDARKRVALALRGDYEMYKGCVDEGFSMVWLERLTDKDPSAVARAVRAKGLGVASCCGTNLLCAGGADAPPRAEVDKEQVARGAVTDGALKEDL